MNHQQILALGIAFSIVTAGAAHAQKPGQTPPAKPAPAKPAPAKPAAKPSDQQPLAIRGIVSVGLTSLTSSQSFDAVAGTHSKMTFGFGAEIQNIWKNVFAGVAYSPLSLEGERVFVDSGTVYPLGIPVDISVNSLDIVGGWRFVPKPKGAKPAPPKPGQKPAAKKEPLASLTTLAQAKGQPPRKPAPPAAPAAKAPQPTSKAPRLVPFIGGGLSMAMYKETSQNAGGDDVSKSASGFVFLGGVDYRLNKWVQVGGEFRYRAVTGVLGSGGVSQVYGEKSLGGWVVAARVSIGKSFGKK